MCDQSSPKAEEPRPSWWIAALHTNVQTARSRSLPLKNQSNISSPPTSNCSTQITVTSVVQAASNDSAFQHFRLMLTLHWHALRLTCLVVYGEWVNPAVPNPRSTDRYRSVGHLVRRERLFMYLNLFIYFFFSLRNTFTLLHDISLYAVVRLHIRIIPVLDAEKVGDRWVNLPIVSALHLVLWTAWLYRQPYVVSLSYDKCT